MIEYFNINNRRYLGNKFKMLPFIRKVVDQECDNVCSFFDVFSGTGSVSSAFTDKQLFVNDLMYCNYLAELCWFSPKTINVNKIKQLIEYYNSYDASNEDNYMSQTFSDTYFSRLVCQKIGFIRDNIENMFLNKEINERERAVLITSMTYSMDRIANTYGHYDSFIQNVTYDNNFLLRMPSLSENLNQKNKCFNLDANILAPNVECDVAYLDPPYNSRQYCDAYHLLENVALWNKPQVEGVARKMDRKRMKSDYCHTKANLVLEDLVNKLNCRYLILSYNNNGNKLQIRSNAKISDEEIMRILSAKGHVTVFSTDYKPFSAGRGENVDNKERIFLCDAQR